MLSRSKWNSLGINVDVAESQMSPWGGCKAELCPPWKRKGEQVDLTLQCNSRTAEQQNSMYLGSYLSVYLAITYLVK
jgi:hypothetical protein